MSRWRKWNHSCNKYIMLRYQKWGRTWKSRQPLQNTSQHSLRPTLMPSIINLKLIETMGLSSYKDIAGLPARSQSISYPNIPSSRAEPGPQLYLPPTSNPVSESLSGSLQECGLQLYSSDDPLASSEYPSAKAVLSGQLLPPSERNVQVYIFYMLFLLNTL